MIWLGLGLIGFGIIFMILVLLVIASDMSPKQRDQMWNDVRSGKINPWIIESGGKGLSSSEYNLRANGKEHKIKGFVRGKSD